MPRTTGHRQTLVIVVVAIGVAQLCLAGCGDRDYYKDPPSAPEPLPAAEAQTVPPVNLDAGVTEPVRTDAPLVPTTRDITMDPRKPKDKTDKADIYWKLVYLAGAAGARRPTETLKKQISDTLDDPAKELMKQIVTALERANDASVARRRPGRPGALTDDLPWGADRSEFEKSLAPAPDETGTPSTIARRKQQLDDFNARYKVPPEVVRANSVQEAQSLIAELRRTLDEERKRDGDFAIGTSDPSSPAAPEASAAPDELVIPPP